jgi:Tol biopolymer transport system component
VPKIGLYNVKTGKTNLLKGGYANPSWSPDGRVIVAERTDGNGRDIVIIDPRNGAEIVRLTNDGNSFAPVLAQWRPGRVSGTA